MNLVMTMTCHEEINCLALRSGQIIAGCNGSDGSICLFDTKMPNNPKIIDGMHSDDVTGLFVDSNGMLASCSTDGLICLNVDNDDCHVANTGISLAKIVDLPHSILAISHTDNVIFVEKDSAFGLGRINNIGRIGSLINGSDCVVDACCENGVLALYAGTFGGDYLKATCQDDAIEIESIMNRGHDDVVRCVASCESVVISGGDDGRIVLWQ